MMRPIIAALDLGTSKSIAIVAQKEYSNRLSVKRYENTPSKNAIRRGRIYNSEEASEIVSTLFRKLNSDPDNLQIDKIYVGIGGQSLRSQPLIIQRIVESGTIDRHLLESLEREAQHFEFDFEDNLAVSSCEYYADGQLVQSAKGTEASVIEARFQLVVGNPCLKISLEKVFKEKDIQVAGYFISPLATAEAVLTQDEKEAGCALVEIGEGVTYVSVYKDKMLKYLVTLPIGGLAITKDIRNLHVSQVEAEVLKLKHGKAISDPDDEREVPVNEESNSLRKVSLKNLNWIIEARIDEIVKNVWNQIELSGYSQMIEAGIIITGGGALIKDLPKKIKNQTGKEVRQGKAKLWVKQVETLLSPVDSCVAGLLLLGKETCVKEETIIEAPTPQPSSEPGKNFPWWRRDKKTPPIHTTPPVTVIPPIHTTPPVVAPPPVATPPTPPPTKETALPLPSRGEGGLIKKIIQEGKDILDKGVVVILTDDGRMVNDNRPLARKKAKDDQQGSIDFDNINNT